MTEGSGFPEHDAAFFKWAQEVARNFAATSRFRELARSIGAHDLLMEVWERPAFVAMRHTWKLDAEGRPTLDGSPAAPRAYLRRALANQARDHARRQKTRREFEPRLVEELDEVREPPPPPPFAAEMDCPRRCLDAAMRRNGLHAWIWFCTHVEKLRDPEELARETGLSAASIHKLARRVDVRIKACVEDCEAERGGGR